MNFVKAFLLLYMELQLATLLFSALPSAEHFEEGLLAATPKVVQYAGRPVSLTCEIPNPGKRPTFWSKIFSDNSGRYVSISNGTELQDNRYTLVENHRRSTTTLKIENLQETDAGLYQCTLTFTNDTLQFSYKVELGVRQ